MTHRHLLAMLAAAAIITPLYAADTPGTDPAVRKPSVNERMASARKMLQAHDYTKAAAELNVVIKEDPRHADAYSLLGYSWRKRTNPDVAKAMEYYQAALKIDPRHKGAHEYVGEAYLMVKNPAEAEKHLAELERLCGNKTCEEYVDLAKSIADYKSKN